MAASEEKRINDRQIRVGLVAPAERAPQFVEALRGNTHFVIAAQAGMPQSAALPAIEWFSDQRVLAAQGGIDLLIACAAPRAMVDLSAIAAAHAVHLWRMPPPGRSFAETTEIVQRHRAAGLVYRIASWWDMVADALRTCLEHADGLRPLLSEVYVRAAGPTLEQWPASQVDFGGGVLAADAYGMLEALVAVRGLPDSLVASTGRFRRAAAGAPRETEDVALAILRYEGGGLGMIRAAWDIQPFKQTTLHHSADRSMRFTLEEVALVDASWRRMVQRPLPRDLLLSELAILAGEIRGDRDRTQGQERHIAVAALLEAAYLSARTGQPESPQKLYDVQKWPVPRR